MSGIPRSFLNTETSRIKREAPSLNDALIKEIAEKNWELSSSGDRISGEMIVRTIRQHPTYDPIIWAEMQIEKSKIDPAVDQELGGEAIRFESHARKMKVPPVGADPVYDYLHDLISKGKIYTGDAENGMIFDPVSTGLVAYKNGYLIATLR